MVWELRSSSAAIPSSVSRRIVSGVSQRACRYRVYRSSTSTKSWMSLVAVSVPGRRAGHAAAVRVAPPPISRAIAWAFWRSRSANPSRLSRWGAKRTARARSARWKASAASCRQMRVRSTCKASASPATRPSNHWCHHDLRITPPACCRRTLPRRFSPPACSSRDRPGPIDPPQPASPPREPWPTIRPRPGTS